MEKRKDYLDGDHSFKNWFRIMWTNGYVFLFLIGLFGMAAQAMLWNDMVKIIKDSFLYDGSLFAILSILAMAVPTAIVILVSYKGFYQFWNDLKNGRSR